MACGKPKFLVVAAFFISVITFIYVQYALKNNNLVEVENSNGKNVEENPDEISISLPPIPEEDKDEQQVQILTYDYNYEFYRFTKIPKLESHWNKARVLEGTCLPLEKKLTSHDELQMVAVTNYIPVDILHDLHSIYAERPPTDEEEEARIAEITSTFQDNLNHPHVKVLYIFVQFSESVNFLRSLNFSNSDKLVIQWTKKNITVVDMMKYISKCFNNEIVALIHQDNKLGIGFDKVDPNVLIKNKLVYALTRQPTEHYCFHSWNSAVCDLSKPFYGSHDTFIFHVKGFTDADLQFMSINNTHVENNESGYENLFVYMFQEKLGFRAMNPCLILYVHHQHCVPIRKSYRRRVNNVFSKWAGITSNLV